MCGENPSAADERRSLLRESETMARNVRKYVCGIVHMQVGHITVTRDFDDIESDTLASYRELLSIPLHDARALDLCPCITRDVPYDARMVHDAP